MQMEEIAGPKHIILHHKRHCKSAHLSPYHSLPPNSIPIPSPPTMNTTQPILTIPDETLYYMGL